MVFESFAIDERTAAFPRASCCFPSTKLLLSLDQVAQMAAVLAPIPERFPEAAVAAAVNTEVKEKSLDCRICGKLMGAGEEIFPTKDRNKPGFIWAHYECAKRVICGNGASVAKQPSAEKRKVCKHWLKKGKCAFGDGCFFAHTATGTNIDDELSRAAQAKPRRSRIRNGLTRRAGRQRPKVANTSRCAILRRFILDRVHIDRLRKGSGVLDVAGGKGELAFELNHVNGIPATVVDPRPMLLSKFRRKYNLGVYHRNPAFSRWSIAKKEKLDRPLTCKHLRLFFDSNLFAWERNFEFTESEGNIEWLNNARDVARTTCWTSKGLYKSDSDMSETDDDEEEHSCGANDYGDRYFQHAINATKELDGDGDIIDDCNDVYSILKNASCVFGMHPDQAAEHIVDFALEHNIPFALVPCCVYSKQFPKRKLPDGTLVKSHEQLLQHLRSKDKRIKQELLPFEGKNIVLWFDPEASTGTESDGVLGDHTTPTGISGETPTPSPSQKSYMSYIFDAVRKEVERREGGTSET